MRTLEQIIDSVKLELSSNNSPLANFNKFSNLYVLFRTVAKSILEVESYVEEQSEQKYISGLSGSDLELKALEYGLQRNSEGAKAIGSVLVSSSLTTNAPFNIVLTDLESNNQFFLLSNVIADSNEKVVTVQSVESKFVAIPAGTTLYSSLYPNVTFIVGSFRDTVTSLPQGDIIGGSEIEDDESLRRRIIQRMNSSYISTESGIVSSLLEEVNLERVYIKNNYPLTGYLSVFIDSDDELIKQQTQTVLENTIAAGTNYYIYPIKKQAFDFNINLFS